MKAEIQKKNLVITIPIELPLPRSKSGKTLLLSSPLDKEKVELEVLTMGLNFVNISVTAWMYPPTEGRTGKGKKLTKKESEAIEKHNREVTEKMNNEKKA